jgi:hypothetical protein
MAANRTLHASFEVVDPKQRLGDRVLLLRPGTDLRDAAAELRGSKVADLHVRALLVDAEVPDPDTLVDSLLAPLAPDVYQYQRRRGRRPQQISDSLAWQARRILDPSAAGPQATG